MTADRRKRHLKILELISREQMRHCPEETSNAKQVQLTGLHTSLPRRSD